MTVAAEIAALEAEQAAIQTTLGTLADVVQVSEQGRGVQSDSSRDSLARRLKEINERLALLQPFEFSDVRR